MERHLPIFAPGVEPRHPVHDLRNSEEVAQKRGSQGGKWDKRLRAFRGFLDKKREYSQNTHHLSGSEAEVYGYSLNVWSHFCGTLEHHR